MVLSFSAGMLQDHCHSHMWPRVSPTHMPLLRTPPHFSPPALLAVGRSLVFSTITSSSRHTLFLSARHLRAHAQQHYGWKGPYEHYSSTNILPGFAQVPVKGEEAPFRAPEVSSPLARGLFFWLPASSLRVPQKSLLGLKGEAEDGVHNSSKENVATLCSSNLRVPQLLPLFLLGLGAFFTLQFPALADFERHGGAAAVLRRTTVSEIINSGWAGLMAGCLHTLTGPDHLAALAPLCIGRAKLESAVVGALWGCGHDAGQIIFGVIFLLLKGKLKIELLQVWASRVVGITLLAIGAVGLKEAQEIPVSVLAGEGATTADSSEIVENRKTTHRLRTFATGIVYGLQPDALIMILPALALPSRLAGAAYLGMFLLGTIVAMGSYTAFIGSCGQALQKRLPWITRRLTLISSVIAIVFGIGVLLGELFGINFF